MGLVGSGRRWIEQGGGDVEICLRSPLEGEVDGGLPRILSRLSADFNGLVDEVEDVGGS